MFARLVALDAGPDIVLDRAMMIVGRHPSCDTRLDFPRVSRHHCCLMLEAGDLWVYGTHLDNPKGAGDVRLEQVNQLLGVWNGHAPAIIGGDFNALPDSDVMATFAGAGFVDVGTALDPEAFTSEAGHRIDYILTTGGLSTRDVRIPDVWTSDHKPVVVELTIGA